jgi:exonuclease VII small subunit
MAGQPPDVRIEKAIKELSGIVQGLRNGSMTNQRAARMLERPMQRLYRAHALLSEDEDDDD